MSTHPTPGPHDADVGRTISRRDLLAGGAAAISALATLAACGSDDLDRAGGDSSGTSQPSTGYVLVQNFPSIGYAVTGSLQRLPLLLSTADGAPVDDVDGPLALTVRRDGRVVGERIEVRSRGAGLPRPFLPLEITFPEPGTYEISGRYRRSDLVVQVSVGDAGSTVLPQRGAPLPSVPTPTVADAMGVEPLCTREPACPLHEHDLATSLAQGRPVALLVSTPAYCQTAICGPVLDLVVDAAAAHPDLDFIHCEVYANPTAVDNVQSAERAPIVAAFDMPFEPVLWVTDASGSVVDRYDSIFDRDQLAEVLRRAVA